MVGSPVDGVAGMDGPNRCLSAKFADIDIFILMHPASSRVASDTVPNAGAFDGIPASALGIAVSEELQGRRRPFSIEVIGFSEEEGVRFSKPFLGSLALVEDWIRSTAPALQIRRCQPHQRDRAPVSILRFPAAV